MSKVNEFLEDFDFGDFLPVDYQVPNAVSKFTKIEKDKETRIRILSTPLIGWQYFSNKKSIVKKLPFSKEEIIDADIDPFTKSPSEPQEFWAMKVYNYGTKQMEIFQTTKKAIKIWINTYNTDEDFGKPNLYDLKITKTGEWKDTKYSIIAVPPKPVSDEVKEAFYNTYIDLSNMLIWEDPFRKPN